MSRIVFDYARPVVESDPARNDIACFVGLARVTGTALPSAIQNWLTLHGWTNGPLARSLNPPFTDIPIPLESYATFTALFDPGGSADSDGTDYLAAAVRSFFAQGGRRCYVVCMGEPLLTAGDDPQAKLASLLPGDLYAVDDRRSWHGVGHLGGLPDVSFLILPDLPALSASAFQRAVGVTPVAVSGASQFVECTPPASNPPPIPLYPLPAPRLTPDDYKQTWAPAVQKILDYLNNNNIREIQFVAAFPLPQDLDAAAAAENPSSAALAQDIHSVITCQFLENIPNGATEPPPVQTRSTAFLQLSYPWLKTTGSHVLNESLEPAGWRARRNPRAQCAHPRSLPRRHQNRTRRDLRCLAIFAATGIGSAHRAVGMGRQFLEASDHPVQPVWIYPRGSPPAFRCHHLSGRSLPPRVRASSGLGNIASVPPVGRANCLPQ